MLDIRTIETLIAKTYTTDFAEIVLTQQAEVTPEIYRGPGSITQNAQGKLQLKVYLTHDVAFPDSFQQNFSTYKPGKLLDDSYYFRMEATDYRGNTWRCDRLHISRDIVLSAAGDASGTINAAVPHIEVITERQGDIGGNKIWLAILGKLPIPFNTREELGVDFSLTKLKAKLFDDTDVEIMKRDGYTLLFATHEISPIDEKTIDKLLEGLSIATGQYLQRVYKCVRHGNMEKFWLGSYGDESNARHLPPPLSISTQHAVAFTEFLSRYIAFSRETHHSYFGYWQKLYSAWQAGLMVSALPIAIYLEGLVNEFFEPLTAEDPTVVKSVQYMIDVLDKLELDTAHRERIKGSVKNVANGSVARGLRHLAREGWFEPSLVKTWREVRNKSAHAFDFTQEQEHEKIQIVVSAVLACLHLFYVLLMIRINFRSIFIDLSQLGFPERKLLPLPSTDT